MMKNESYQSYLETVVLSLLAERRSDKDIVVTDAESLSPLAGSTISINNLLAEIESQRRRRFQLVIAAIDQIEPN